MSIRAERTTTRQKRTPRPPPLALPPAVKRLLTAALRQALDDGGQSGSPLAKAMQAAGVELCVDPATFFESLHADGIRSRLLVLIKALASLAAMQPAHSALGALDRELGWLLLLAGAHRYAELVLGQPIDMLFADGQTLAAPDQFNAEVAAGLAHGGGLRLMRAGSGNAPGLCVSNCLVEAPHLRLTADRNGRPVSGDTDLAMAWLAETQAWADMNTQGPDLYRQLLGQGPPTKGRSSVVSVSLLRHKLAEIETAQGIRPFILLTTDAQTGLAGRPAAQRLIQEHGGLRVAMAHIGPPDNAFADLPQVQATISGLLADFFNAVHGLPAPPSPPAARRRGVFISYAHKDGQATLDKLLVHLSGVAQSGLSVWSDKRIGTGDAWRQEIETAMAQADCAVLILTPGFLASKFINVVELPALLGKHRASGMRIKPLLAEGCLLPLRDDLNWLQIASGDKPLRDLTRTERSNRLVQFATEILQSAQGQA